MPRPLLLALLVLALPLCTAAASVPRDEYEVERTDLEGTWRVIVVKIGEEESSVPKGEEDWCLVVKQNRVTVTTIKDRWFYRIDPGRKPAHIDRLADGTPGAKVVNRGIYRLSGNRLTICWGAGGSRPKDFVSRLGRSAVVELVRVK